MGVSPLVAVVALALFVVVVLLMWWLRYSEKKKVVQNVTRHPQPYLGRMANNVYRIPLNHNYIYQTPPPSFRKALKYPVPKQRATVVQVAVINIEEIPPPTYEQYLKTQQQQYCSNDISKSATEQCCRYI